MAKLVLLVIAAMWAAVLLPPLLRSRVENRPNSSVVDFRRQLSRLQSSSTPVGAVRPMGRPLTSAHRQHAGAPAMKLGTISSRQMTQPGSMRTAPTARRHEQRAGNVYSGRGIPADFRPADERTAPAARQHGGARPAARDHQPASRQHQPMRRHGHAPAIEHGHLDPHEAQFASAQARSRSRAHDTRTHGMERPAAAGRSQASELQRRRNNVLFMLGMLAAGTLFLYATTDSEVMMYGFALSFLAFCGYVYLLAQVRQREGTAWGANDHWLN